MRAFLVHAVAGVADPATHGQTGIKLWGPLMGIGVLLIAIRLMFGKRRR